MHTALKCGIKNKVSYRVSITHSARIPNIAGMYGKLQLAFKYLQYYITASNGKGHGIHSPFVFDFVTNVLTDKRSFYCYKTVEYIREELKQNDAVLSIEDFGAGSHTKQYQQRKISSIAISALKPAKFGQLLFRMADQYQPDTILELGTSLGITTSYLACAKNDAHVITMEGAAAVASVAKQNFARLQLQNIELITGNFDDTLPDVLSTVSTLDFVFIDGNHRKQPTLNYFIQLLSKVNQKSVLIFDDIHWSREMEEAWRLIKENERVTLTIDLFFIGIVFFRKENKEKQHFVIRF